MPYDRQMPRRRPRKRKRLPIAIRFVRRYFPTIVFSLLVIVCISTVVLTASAISDTIRNRPRPELNQNATPTEPPLDSIAVALLNKADLLAAGYDYASAITLLQAYDGYENIRQMTEAIDDYTQRQKAAVPYTDMDNITHIFFHSLIVDTDRAFDGDVDTDGYNLYMVTVNEFKAILQSMYDRGYVLVSPYDIAYEAEGSGRFQYGTIRLPEGKTPFLMSQDDVNYYSYMIGTGSGVNETPIFADKYGDGFASRIVIGEDGYPTCEYMDANGNILTGDYDLVPILEKFIQEHPDFSYHGARAILGVTGYEGVFGYRTKPSYEENLGSARYRQEVEDAKAVAQCLKEHGWILASHSYGHPSYGRITADRVATDSDKWEATVEYIIGETDIILYPNGSDIETAKNYTFDNEKFKALYDDGYRYFFNVDSKVAWCQVGTNYFRGSRRNIDGYRMFHNPDRLNDLFDVSEVFDPARPTPVPTI